MREAAASVPYLPLLSKREPCHVLLIGRPNSGKSTLYNCLTQGAAKVGNYPGTTVDILESSPVVVGDQCFVLFDLPGIYSMKTANEQGTDEEITHQFLSQLAVNGEGCSFSLIQVLDGTQLPLHLGLTRELLHAGFAPLLVITQADRLAQRGQALNIDLLEQTLGLPALLVDARDEISRAPLFETLIDLTVRRISSSESVWDPYTLTQRVLTPFLPKNTSEWDQRSAQLDRILLHPVAGLLLFGSLLVTLLAAIFFVSHFITQTLEQVLAWIETALLDQWGQHLFSSFLINGLLEGGGTLLAFVPQVVMLTVAIECLEASGYLVRGAFLVDRFLRFFGLSGSSFLPLLMGHACAVPAIGATRVIRDTLERLTALLVIPLMTCSARLPTYSLLISAFFASAGPWVQALLFLGMYGCGVAMGLVVAWLLRRTVIRGRSLPLLAEIPPYRFPKARVILSAAKRDAVRFIKEVGVSILIASSLMWVFLTLPSPIHSLRNDSQELDGTVAIEESIAATLGKALEPVTNLIGFDWRINVGLIGALGAREVMVGTLSVVFGLEGEEAKEPILPLAQRIQKATKPDGTAAYTAATGFALLTFFLLACQCTSTLAAIHRETRTWKWPLFLFAYTYALAYACAWLAYRLVQLFR
ncbi:ferrous iron transporter B [Pajaroellobacter abortibovis]|uniref:FeoB-type G domain-containing protein n=1 Tax=Pajaroellobacter abortibovis TaxID=1882918 RepID=A0A1L6MYQ4_9BACT|nr:ferrous iron transporter B [Pajaroellobacter abortibovis]APS00545.1 hypothetical protein BCY86_07545 [Pajaroellobacter abortibovis]